MSQRLVDAMARDRGVDSGTVWAEIDATYPSGRTATEEEVAHAIALLADEAAGGISGQNLTVAMGSSW
jgi:NAD(P)-dependent dehydrogenase (short-subunit alcohol dehydrogenase family)